MGISRIAVEPNTQTIQMSCSGKSFPNPPYSHTSPLMPLTLATEPIIQKFQSRTPVSFAQPVPTKAILLNKAGQLDDLSARFRCRLKNYYMRNLVKRNEDDHHGQECWYSGSCVRVVEDLVLFTGNTGRLRVAKLMEDERRVFDRVPGDVVSVGDRKLKFGRILSLHVQSQGAVLVGARYRWGVGLFRILEEEDGQTLGQVKRIPCSEGTASIAFLSGNQVGCLGRDGELGLWDISTGLRMFNNILGSMVDANYLGWGWGVLCKGFHPKSVLVGDRENVFGVDLRSGNLTQVGLGVKGWEHIRAMDSEEMGSYVYTVTDKNIILTDLRQPKAPVLRLGHGLGGRSRVWGMGRVRLEWMDWVVVYDRWGEMGLTLLDWGHSQCEEWESQSDLVILQCERPAKLPVLLGGCRGVGGWRDTVARGREEGGEWLDSCVEDRCGVGFTGVDLARQGAGPVMIYAVNAAGDLFAKTVVPKIDALEDSELEQELVENRETAWLADWADSVVGCSLLPEISLRCRQRVLSEKVGEAGITMREWSLPVTVKTKDWRRRFKLKKKNKIQLDGTGTVSVENVEDEEEGLGERVSIQRTGLPRLATSGWSPEIYENVTTKGRQWRKYKTLKVEELRKMLAEMGRGTILHPAKSSLYLTPNTNHVSAVNHPTVDVNKKFSPILNCRQEEGESVSLHGQMVPHLGKLDLNNYTPNTTYKYSNRHSENILKIMMGQGETGRGAQSRPNPSQLASGHPAPASPREEDSTFTMDAFWADLGVEAPHPPTRKGSQTRSFASSDQEDG